MKFVRVFSRRAAALLCGCAAFILQPAQAQGVPPGLVKPLPTAAIPQAQLRERAEQVYTRVRESLEDKDYDTFLRLTLPAGNGKPPPKAVFDQIAATLLDDYPVLGSLNFVRVETSGDWIGYYAESRIRDPLRIYIYMFRFKRAGDDLKLSGRVTVKDIPYQTAQYRTLDEIQLNPVFRLPGQKGYKEK